MTSIQQNRARCTISYSRLQELMKTHIANPTDDWIEHENHEQTIQLYFSFFKALAEETNRVNKVAVSTSAQSLWKMAGKKASLFGAALEAALRALSWLFRGLCSGLSYRLCCWPFCGLCCGFFCGFYCGVSCGLLRGLLCELFLGRFAGCVLGCLVGLVVG